MAYSIQKCKCGKSANYKVLVAAYNLSSGYKRGGKRYQAGAQALPVCGDCLQKPTVAAKKALLASCSEAGQALVAKISDAALQQTPANTSTGMGYRKYRE